MVDRSGDAIGMACPGAIVTDGGIAGGVCSGGNGSSASAVDQPRGSGIGSGVFGASGSGHDDAGDSD